MVWITSWDWRSYAQRDTSWYFAGLLSEHYRRAGIKRKTRRGLDEQELGNVTGRASSDIKQPICVLTAGATSTKGPQILPQVFPIPVTRSKTRLNAGNLRERNICGASIPDLDKVLWC